MQTPLDQEQRAAAIRPYLDPGEQLLWTGAPVGGLRFPRRSLFISAAGLFFLAFSLFWVVGAGAGIWSGEWRAEHGFLRWFMFLFPAFGLPFVMGSLYAVFGHYLTDMRRRAMTQLALTERRALILVGGRKPVLTSWPINSDTVVEYKPGPEAMFHFATIVDVDSEGSKSLYRTGFDLIPDGEKVYRLIRQIQTGTL